ncbi:MAG: hypothetical protein ACRCXC_05415 [Legionella sp.]
MPESYSIISANYTGAIDVTTNLDDFNKLKVPVKKALQANKTPEEIALLVQSALDKADHDTKASNVRLVFYNGVSVFIPTVLELRNKLDLFDDPDLDLETLLSLANEA